MRLDAYGLKKDYGVDGDYGARDRFRNELNEVCLGLVPLEMSGRYQGRGGHLIPGHKKLQPRGKAAVRNTVVDRRGNATGRKDV